MSAKLIISLIIFITSIIVVVAVKDKEKKDKELKEKKSQMDSIIKSPKCPPLDIINKESELYRINHEFTKIDGQLLIPIGLVSNEKLKIIDFYKENNILIIGTTGGGKSTCLNEIVFSLAMNYSKEEIDIVTIDTSFVELGSFNGIPQYLKDSIFTPKDIVEELSILYKEAEKRIKNPYKKKLIVMIDDLYDVCSYDKNALKTIEKLLKISKDANMYFILATDTPKEEILTEDFKEKLDATLYLTLSPGEEKDFSFENELSEEDLQFLTREGCLIYKEKDTTKKVTIPDITEKDIKKLKDWFIHNR